MKKAVALLAFVAIASFASPECNYAAKVADFEKRMGLRKVMEGAFEKVDDNIVKKRSLPIPSGKDKGMWQTEEFFIGENCRIGEVVLSVVDPVTKKYVSMKTAVMREDGSLKAICEGISDVVSTSDDDPEKFEINKNCECYGRNWKKVPFGKYGCLDNFEVKYLLKNR